MLLAYAVVFCLAFTAAVLCAPVVRLLAVRIGAVDRPDGKRKIHSRPMPRLGGLVIMVAIVGAVALYLCLTPSMVSVVRATASSERIAGFLIGFVIILGLGIWDDIKGVRPRTKILFQTLAVLSCYAVGFRVEMPLIGKGQLVYLALPLTWFWLVACINAMNLVDGMDGLASGVAFFAAAVIFVLAAFYSKLAVALMAAALLGSVVGFLMYNFHPAVMFLGDSGSMLLGYTIAVLAIAGSLKSHATVALLIPILALGLPIMDTLLAILRRWSRRLPISQADREHVHHRLLAMGLSHRQAVVVLYVACITLAAGALAVATRNSLAVGVMLGMLFLVGITVVHTVGVGELAAFFRRLGERLRASGHERRIAAVTKAAFCLRQARTWDDVRGALEPYLESVGAAGAVLARGGAGEEVLVKVGAEVSRDADGGRHGGEVLVLKSGARMVLWVEGTDCASSALPEELRRALLEALNAVDQQGREPEAGKALGPLREGLTTP